MIATVRVKTDLRKRVENKKPFPKTVRFSRVCLSAEKPPVCYDGFENLTRMQNGFRSPLVFVGLFWPLPVSTSLLQAVHIQLLFQAGTYPYRVTSLLQVPHTPLA